MAQKNEVFVRGNLTKDAEFQNFENGLKLCTLTIGVNDKYKDKDGQEVEKASFFTIEAWNEIAESMKDAKKGQDIRTEGRLKQDRWEKDGKENSAMKIVATKIETDAEWKPENKVEIEGNLTDAPEFRTISGKTMCKFTVGVNRHYKTESGEKKEKVCFVDIEAWGKTAELMKDAKKGQEFKTIGKLKQERWEKDGVKHSKVKINANNIAPVTHEKKIEKKDPERDYGMCF